MLQPGKWEVFDLHFNLTKLDSLPYFEQVKSHLDTGYPRLWGPWVSLEKEIVEYNVNQATAFEGKMSGFVRSRLRELFTQPPLGVTTALHSEIFVETICDEVTNFWRQTFLGGGSPPLRLALRESSSRMMQLNGRDVFWNDSPDELKSGEQFLVALALLNIAEAAELFDQFRKTQEAYGNLARRLAEFQKIQIIPIRNSFQDEGYLEGKCDHCPTPWKLFRRYF